MLITHIPYLDITPFCYGTSVKLQGDMKDRENRIRFYHSLGFQQEDVFEMGQMHSSHVQVITHDEGKIIENCDGLVCDFTKRKRSILLTVLSADCTPVILIDQEHDIGGICHAGFKGLQFGIIQSMINAMQHLGSGNLIKIICMPHIQSCCYDISSKDAKMWVDSGYNESIYYRDNRCFLSMSEVIKKQMRDIGLSDTNIIVHQNCTKHMSSKYYSYRASGHKVLGEQITFLGLRYG